MRLLLALLALVLALPAATVPVCAEAPRTHAMAGMPMPVDEGDEHRAMPGHVCIGCVPAGDWLRPVVVAPLVLDIAAPVAIETRLVPGRAIGPPLPPPRG